MKGNKRELIQLGVPIFGHIKDDATSDNETSIFSFPIIDKSVISSTNSILLSVFSSFLKVSQSLFYSSFSG